MIKTGWLIGWLLGWLMLWCCSPVSGLAQSGSSMGSPTGLMEPPLLPAELSVTASPYPDEIVMWLEEGRADRVAPALQALIAAQPQSLPLRALKVQLEALTGLDELLQGTLEQPAPELPLADRFEALQRQLTRLELERKHYRGDQEEPAAAFIERMESTASRLVEGFEALQVENVKGHPDPLHDPEVLLGGVRLALSRAYALQLGQELNPMERQFVWQTLQGEGDWLFNLRLTALEGQLVPESEGRAWLDATCAETPKPESMRRSTSLWARCRLLWLQQRARGMGYEEAAQLYRSAQADFQETGLVDDLRLSLARALGRGYARASREEAVRVYQGLLEGLETGKASNTQYPAALELCQLLRRLNRFDEVVQVANLWRAKAAHIPYSLDREEGRALYALGRYPESLETLKRLVESPRGRGADYLLMVEAMRPLVGTPLGEGRDLRREALQLADFAQLAMSEEARVVGWTSGQAPPLRELYARLAELNALSRHATLFPAPFALGGARLLMEVLAVALGVMGIASWPRLVKRLWRSGGLVSLWGVLPAAWVLGAPQGLEGLSQVGWVGQGLLRVGLLWLGGLLLGKAAGLPLLGMRRFWREIRRGEVAGAFTFGMLVLGVVSLELLSLYWGAPVPYLERFPASLMSLELRAVPEGLPLLNRLGLVLSGVVLYELLCRGVLLGGVALVGKGWRMPVVLVVSAVMSAALRLGGLEPVGVQLGVGVMLGGLLGWVRIRQGLDMSLLLALVGALGAVGLKSLWD
ncbi:MAG: hypothetical protein ACKO6N_18635 [Myxococcota bacterium]